MQTKPHAVRFISSGCMYSPLCASHQRTNSWVHRFVPVSSSHEGSLVPEGYSRRTKAMTGSIKSPQGTWGNKWHQLVDQLVCRILFEINPVSETFGPPTFHILDECHHDPVTVIADPLEYS